MQSAKYCTICIKTFSIHTSRLIVVNDKSQTIKTRLHYEHLNNQWEKRQKGHITSAYLLRSCVMWSSNNFFSLLHTTRCQLVITEDALLWRQGLLLFKLHFCQYILETFFTGFLTITHVTFIDEIFLLKINANVNANEEIDFFAIYLVLFSERDMRCSVHICILYGCECKFWPGEGEHLMNRLRFSMHMIADAKVMWRRILIIG